MKKGRKAGKGSSSKHLPGARQLHKRARRTVRGTTEAELEAKRAALSPDRRKRVEMVSYLFSRQVSQSKIINVVLPKDYAKPEPEISRLLGTAYELNFLNLEFNRDLVSPATREHCDREIGLATKKDDLLRVLKSYSGDTLKSLTVRYSGDQDAASAAERAQQVRVFANNAHEHVFELLVACKVALGVCWGPLLFEIGSELQTYRRPGQRFLDITVFPTIGLPPGLQGVTKEWSSTDVTRPYSRALTGQESGLSLEAITPLLEGEDAEEPNRTIIINHYKRNPAYRAIYGPGKPPGTEKGKAPGKDKPADKNVDKDERGLIDKADGLITGAGISDRWPSLGGDIVLSDKTISGESLRQRTVGDMGGVLILAPGQSPDGEFKEARQQWIGLTLKHIRQVNENANQTGGPGVVLCAIGCAKAELVYEVVITHRVVRHLIIDQHLADALWELLVSRHPQVQK